MFLYIRKIIIVAGYILAGFIGTAAFFSCTEDPPPSLRYEDRKIIDSIFKENIALIKPKLDSICELNYDNKVQKAIDSIMEVRLREIDKQLNRVKE